MGAPDSRNGLGSPLFFQGEEAVTTVTECEFEGLNPGMLGRRRKESDVEEAGIIRRMIQDVLVPEMQGIKERLAGYDEKFVSIDKRFEQVDRRFVQVEARLDRIEARLDNLEAEMRRGFAALTAAIERIETRLSFSELDKRLVRLEILQERGASGPKSSAA
jgi:chromosome segregation ATPase